MLPLALCVCGKALSPGDVLCDNPAMHCVKQLKRVMFGHEDIEMVSVPLDYHGELLGMYNVYVHKPGISGREDIIELLQTIGSHLGHGGGQAALRPRGAAPVDHGGANDAGARAARLAGADPGQPAFPGAPARRPVEAGRRSARRRARMPSASASGLDEAHTELRELLNSFRAPVDERGLVSALEKLVGALRSRNRHSCAVSERVPRTAAEFRPRRCRCCVSPRSAWPISASMRRRTPCGYCSVVRQRDTYSLLVEDDGVGFEDEAKHGRPGEHIGLSIMEERARRLGGNLRIESEVG